MQKTDSKEKFQQDLDTCLVCDKPKLTLQNPLGSLTAESCKVPVVLLVITPPHSRDRTLSIFSMNLLPQSILLLFLLVYEVPCTTQADPRAMWGLRAPDQAVPQLSLFPSPGMKVQPPSSVSLLLSKTIFLFYCTHHFRRRPVFKLWPYRHFLLASAEDPTPIDFMWMQWRLVHLSIVRVIHTESNPHIFLFIFSVLSVFCHCHQELHVLKHLWAQGFIKDLFFGRISFIYLISP